MRLIPILLTGLPILLVAVYTFNYGRWAWRQRLRLGAVGLYLLSVATLMVPLLVMWANR